MILRARSKRRRIIGRYLWKPREKLFGNFRLGSRCIAASKGNCIPSLTTDANIGSGLALACNEPNGSYVPINAILPDWRVESRLSRATVTAPADTLPLWYSTRSSSVRGFFETISLVLNGQSWKQVKSSIEQHLPWRYFCDYTRGSLDTSSVNSFFSGALVE